MTKAPEKCKPTHLWPLKSAAASFKHFYRSKNFQMRALCSFWPAKVFRYGCSKRLNWFRLAELCLAKNLNFNKRSRRIGRFRFFFPHEISSLDAWSGKRSWTRLIVMKRRSLFHWAVRGFRRSVGTDKISQSMRLSWQCVHVQVKWVTFERKTCPVHKSFWNIGKCERQRWNCALSQGKMPLGVTSYCSVSYHLHLDCPFLCIFYRILWLQVPSTANEHHVSGTPNWFLKENAAAQASLKYALPGVSKSTRQ